MPNHVINEITLHDVSLVQASPLIFNGNGEISFSVLLPLPINFWSGSVGSLHEKAFPGTHLDAARREWGTKWDAYGNPTAIERDGSTIITFQTAWGNPRGWVCALFNTLNCRITAKWLDEGALNGVEEVYCPADGDSILGPSWDSAAIPEGSPEHRRLHKMLWGVEEFADEEEAPDDPR